LNSLLFPLIQYKNNPVNIPICIVYAPLLPAFYTFSIILLLLFGCHIEDQKTQVYVDFVYIVLRRSHEQGKNYYKCLTDQAIVTSKQL
jgi:hypothetical protein